MPAPERNNHRFLGRQAILDKELNLYGYELLFRTGTSDAFSGDIEAATNHTIDSCLSMIACSAPTNLFVNCTREALVSRNVMLLPKQTVVLEVLETVNADKDVLEACRDLKENGFRLALDDFSPRDENQELVGLADYVKIDFRASDAAERRKIYDICQVSKPIFLAEKVETLAEVELALEEGNSLFQGYYYSRPEVISEAQINGSKATYLQLLGALASPSLDLRQVERLLLMEPALCFRLLRLANSAAFGGRHRVSTLQGALLAVGEDALRKLVTVVLASSAQQRRADREVEIAIERAYFCESLASFLGESPAELYMLGMLSMMDRMLNVPMSQLVSMISVSPKIEKALLGSQNGMGRALTLCRYHESGGGAQKTVCCVEDPREETASQYFTALLAAGQTMRSMQSVPAH